MLAYFVDSVARGELIEVSRNVRELMFPVPHRVSVLEDPMPLYPSLETVSYYPAVLGGFLWYSRDYHRRRAFECSTGLEVPA